MNVGHRHQDALRCLIAIRFIFVKHLMAERATTHIKTHRNMRGLLALEQILEHIHKAEHRRGVHPAARDARIANQAIIGLEYHSVSIKKEKSFFGFHKHLEGVKMLKLWRLATIALPPKSVSAHKITPFSPINQKRSTKK